MLSPLGSDSEGAGASREGLPTHTQQPCGAGLLQLSIQVPGQLGGARRPCHSAGEGVALILPKCELGPGLTIDLWCQLSPTWKITGGSG